MLIILATILASIAFLVLVRLLWLRAKPGKYGTLITVAAAVLVLGLAVLAATGRLNWLVALTAALFPFLRRGLGLLRYLPFIGSLLARFRQSNRNTSQGAGSRSRSGTMGRQEAIEILGLGSHPSRDEIISAHRRLMQKLHPDRGGSNYLAQQLNEAKQILLEQL